MGPVNAILRTQQIWFERAATESAPVESEAAGILTPGPRMTAIERLQIYRDGYRGRLVECLADDYPAVQHLLGEAAFEALVHRYIDAHPSRSPSLNAFGRSMPAFLKSGLSTDDSTDGSSEGSADGLASLGPFAADLARLEWALVDAIHAAASPPLTIDRLQEMTPEQWGTARLVPAASVRLLRFEGPVNHYYQAFRNDERPTAPDFSSGGASVPTATLVHRQGWVVWRTDLTAPMAQLLEAILAGKPLGEALGAAISDDDEASQANVTRWFGDWVGSGVFTAVELAEP